MFAALILVVSSLATVSDSVAPTADQSVQTSSVESTSMDTITRQAAGGNTHQKNKGFKVSLFLFRID